MDTCRYTLLKKKNYIPFTNTVNLNLKCSTKFAIMTCPTSLKSNTLIPYHSFYFKMSLCPLIVFYMTEQEVRMSRLQSELFNKQMIHDYSRGFKQLESKVMQRT